MSITQIDRDSQIKPATAFNWVTNDSSGKMSQTAVTASSAVATDSNGLPVASSTTATELGFVHGVTSSIQTQLDTKFDTTGTGLTHTGTTVSVSTIPVANGGTGLNTLTAHAVLLGEGTGNVAFAGPGTTAFPLVSNGASADPSFQQLSLTAGVTGTLPVGNGGTNSNTTLANGFLMVSSGGKIVEANGSNYSMDGGQINFLADPTAAQDAATKKYVDMAVNGLTWKSPVRLASAAALATNTYSNGTAGVGATLTATTNGALSVDGVAVVVNDRILVQNESSASHNGIYTVTATGDASNPYVLTRATDSNTPTEVEAGTAVFATEGTTFADKGFLQTTTGTITIGTTSLVYITFTSSVSSYFAGAGLDLTGSTFSISTDNSLVAHAANSTPSLTVKEDPAGAIVTNTGGIAVQVDSSTIQITSNTLSVRLITPSNITLADTKIIVGNGSNVGAAVSMSGDATITDTGIVSISSGLVNHFVTRETPSGSINGINTVFTTANTVVSGTECVYLNGLLQNAGGNDYTFSGTSTITFTVAPESGSVILVNYQK